MKKSATKNNCRTWGLLLLFLVTTCNLWAQGLQIKGKVTDEFGDSLPGVNVVEAGTQNGTMTDLDGNYTLTVNPSAQIQFTFIGMLSVTERVNGRTVINVTLQEDTKKLDEVIVVGYGATKKN